MGEGRIVTSPMIQQISVEEARQRQLCGHLLLDVRTDIEREKGLPHGALACNEADLGKFLKDQDKASSHPLMLICALGQRSIRAARSLQNMGYSEVVSVAGGVTAWIAKGLPLEGIQLDSDARDRYARQLILPEIGPLGQQQLAVSRVALVGVGGLGAPVGLYLAAAGVGQITLIDHDQVERSNLHRQVVHSEKSIGMPKVESARNTLLGLNPSLQIHACQTRLQQDNADTLLAEHDVIVDGADNFPTRYLLSEISLRHSIPLVYAGIERFSGQLSVFDPRQADSPCYRCLYPDPPVSGEAPNCAEAGVLGVLPGVLGTLQAVETLKLLLDLGQSMVGRLLLFDALQLVFHELHLSRDPACPGCGPVTRRRKVDITLPQCDPR